MTFYSNSSNSSNNAAPSATVGEDQGVSPVTEVEADIAIIDKDDIKKGLFVSKVLVESDIFVIDEQDDAEIADKEDLESDRSEDEVKTVESNAEPKETADKEADSKEGMKKMGFISRFFRD